MLPVSLDVQLLTCGGAFAEMTSIFRPKTYGDYIVLNSAQFVLLNGALCLAVEEIRRSKRNGTCFFSLLNFACLQWKRILKITELLVISLTLIG